MGDPQLLEGQKSYPESREGCSEDRANSAITGHLSTMSSYEQLKEVKLAICDSSINISIAI